VQSMDDAGLSARERSLAERFRQSVQGCTSHLHGPVAAFMEIQKQVRESGVRLDVVCEMTVADSRARQEALLTSGVSRDDIRYRKEETVIEFTQALFRGAQMTTTINNHAAAMVATLEPYMEAVSKHSLWSKMTTVTAIRTFMEHHVYCVWDFMTLLKRLQNVYTCRTLPWQPVGSPISRRMINEIVAGEESDELPDGRIFSHYEMYLAAMEEVGCNTCTVEAFRKKALEFNFAFSLVPLVEFAGAQCPRIPVASLEFMKVTMAQAEHMSTRVTLAAFALGREEVIPSMFRETLAVLTSNDMPCHMLREYLDRHIEVDGDKHGPMAMRMLAELCSTPEEWAEATEAAITALKARKALWDAIEAAIG
jgi:hypothetical protein